MCRRFNVCTRINKTFCITPWNWLSQCLAQEIRMDIAVKLQLVCCILALFSLHCIGSWAKHGEHMPHKQCLFRPTWKVVRRLLLTWRWFDIRCSTIQLQSIEGKFCWESWGGGYICCFFLTLYGFKFG